MIFAMESSARDEIYVSRQVLRVTGQKSQCLVSSNLYHAANLAAIEEVVVKVAI